MLYTQTLTHLIKSLNKELIESLQKEVYKY